MKKVMIILGVALIVMSSCQKRKECKKQQNRYNLQKQKYLEAKQEPETHDVTFEKSRLNSIEKTAKVYGCKLKK